MTRAALDNLPRPRLMARALTCGKIRVLVPMPFQIAQAGIQGDRALIKGPRANRLSW